MTFFSSWPSFFVSGCGSFDPVCCAGPVVQRLKGMAHKEAPAIIKASAVGLARREVVVPFFTLQVIAGSSEKGFKNGSAKEALFKYLGDLPGPARQLRGGRLSE